jgi:hypothetical protein
MKRDTKVSPMKDELEGGRFLVRSDRSRVHPFLYPSAFILALYRLRPAKMPRNILEAGVRVRCNFCMSLLNSAGRLSQ